LGRGNAARRVFWAKKTRRLAEFWNRKFSNFCRAAKRKWEAQLEIEIERVQLEIPVGSTGNTCFKFTIDINFSNTFQFNDI
jgi:hypothetical protein